MKADAKTFWTVTIKQGCTLCEVCVAHCPTTSLTLVSEGDRATLFFKQDLCDGCGGRPRCVADCPEKVLTLGRSPSPALRDPRGLVRGKLVRCRACGAFYAPEKKVAVPRRKGKAEQRVKLLEHCPACRRKLLVKSLLENAPAREELR